MQQRDAFWLGLIYVVGVIVAVTFLGIVFNRPEGDVPDHYKILAAAVTAGIGAAAVTYVILSGRGR